MQIFKLGEELTMEDLLYALMLNSANEAANIIGERIKEARVKKGYSQQQLSDKLELMAVYTCRGSVSRIENGKRAVTDIEIDAISKVLDCSLDFLFDRE